MKVEWTEGALNDMEKLFSDKWYYKVLRAWHWCLRVPREAKWKWQRAQRGWSDQDSWGIYAYLGGIIPEMVRHMRSYTGGHPGRLKNMKQWYKILDDMAYGFEQQAKWDADYVSMVGWKKNGKEYYDFKDKEWCKAYEKKQKEVTKAFDKSMKLFSIWFLNLWD